MRPNSSHFHFRKKLAAATAVVGLITLNEAFAQFNAIGFEGATIQNIPYDTTVGIPAAYVAGGVAFPYTFATGNNLQSFKSQAAGTADTDDSPTATGTSVPDYYRSPEFIWRTDGFKTTQATSPGWNTGFNAAYAPTTGGGAADMGHNFPGKSAPQGTNVDGQWSENFNVNRFFSVAAGSLPAAPGLGDQFLDTHLSPRVIGAPSSYVSSQFTLKFSVSTSASLYMTLAFGGRDAESESQRAWYRVYDSTPGYEATLVEGSTADVPFESWYGPYPSVPTKRANDSSTGVAHSDWEYFKSTYSVVSGHSYELQILMPEEINFDMVLGSGYTNIASVYGGTLVAIPEASTNGVAAGILSVGLVLLRRRQNPGRDTNTALA